jgi:pimeloyl-ACP methyl ester carboxylesterase
MCEDPYTSRIYHDMSPVKYKTMTVDGITMFYREAGPPEAPVIVLLHGFPSSSRMFATLFPLLSSKYHLIAPDFPGFGHSDAPSPEKFSYTFEHLTHCVDNLLGQRNISHYALYLQDYGGPIGFRLATANPDRITALIIQNAVVHNEGLSAAWDIRKAYWLDRAAHEKTIRTALLSEEVARQRHLAGVSRPEIINPDTWSDEFVFLTKPGMADIQLELVFDYQSNVAAYPQWQAYLRERQPPTMVVWGKNDPLFTRAGALGFGQEVPDAEIHLLNASHFALDEEVVLIASLIHRFCDTRLSAPKQCGA